MHGMACDFNLLFPVGFAEDKNNKNNNKNLLAVNGSKPLIHPEIFRANQKEDANMHLGKKRPKSRPFTPWGSGGQGEGGLLLRIKLQNTISQAYSKIKTI